MTRRHQPGEAPDPSGYEPKLGRMEEISVSDVLDVVERARTRFETAEDAAALE